MSRGAERMSSAAKGENGDVGGEGIKVFGL